MRRATRSLRLGLLSWSTWVLAVLLFVAPTAASAGTAARAEVQPLVTFGEASAEISFPAPTRHAVVLQESAKLRRLYARGDVIFHPQDPTRSLTIERVDAGALVFHEGPRGRQRSLPTGKPIPGFAGLRLTGTVILDEVYYQYRAVERITHADPVLLSLDGTRAVLEVEVVRSHMLPTGISANVGAPPDPLPVPPARPALDAGLLSQVRIQEVGRGLYEVKGADVQALLEDAGRVLADLAPIVLPIPSFQTGLQYRITSTASDGIISRQGFTVTAPKLAQRAGIETGDTILSVNGRPVNGFASLYTIYREVGRDPTLNTVQVELKRQGTRLTKTYRIR